MKYIPLVIFIFILNASYAYSELKLDSLDKALINKSTNEKVQEYSQIAFALARNERETAKYCLDQAMKYEKSISEDTIRLNLYLTHSLYSRYSDSIDTAFQYLYKALNEAQKIKDNKKFLVKIHNQFANVFGVINDYKESIKHQYKLISYATEIKDTSRIFYSYCNLSNTYLQLDLAKEALEVCNVAQKLVGNKISDLDYQIILLNKGVALHKLARSEEALENFFGALKHYHYLKGKHKNATKAITAVDVQANINIAEVYYDINQLDKSLEFIEIAKSSLKSSSGTYLKISIYTAYAKILFKIGNKKEAFENIKMAKELAEQLKNSFLLKDIYKNLFQFYEKSNNKAHALEYSIKYAKLLDTLRIESNSQLYTNINLMLNLDRASIENERLLHEKEEQEQEKERIERTRLYTIIIASVFFAFSLILIYLLRKNRLINKQLQESEEKQKAINHTKDKFFSIIAHDLRNPLGAYKMLTELITSQAEMLTKEKIVNFVAKMDTSLINTISFVENLLTWARTQSDVIEFKPEPANINKTIKESIQLLKVNADTKLISIISDTEEEINAYFDAYMVSGVIRNLLSNAIKFTPEGGYIEVGVKNDNNKDSIIVFIKDSGVGMSKEQMEKLFRIDANISTLGTYSEKGTGLGLILCKEFVEKHNGKIWVESEENQGSCFQFTLLKNKNIN